MRANTMLDLASVTDETLGEWMKSQTAGILSSTGIYGIDLTGLISLVPVVTPLRNSLPRVTPDMGANVTQWRALLNVNSSQPNAAVALDYAGARVQYEEVNVQTAYTALELVTTITRDAVMQARNYADALGIGTMQNLNQVLISEDINLMNGLAYALPTAGTITSTTSTTGGTLAATTEYDFTVAARSGENYFYGGSSLPATTANHTTGSGATNSITGFIPAVKGAVAYDWYFGAHSGTLYYYTTTTVNTVTFTFLPTANQALPSLPMLSSVAPTAAPTADTSYNSIWMNGLLAQILGDYGSNAIVTPGTATSSGAYFKSNDGAAFTVVSAGIQQLDDLNESLWNNALISPTRYLMASQTAADITTILTASGLAYTVLPPTDGAARANLAAGQYVKWYLNKALGGTPIAIEVLPHMAPGMVVAVSDHIPYPGANIDAPFQVRTLDDYYAFEYAANYNPNTAGGGPRNDVAVRCLETPVVRAPVTCGVVCNIAQTEA